MNPMQLAGGWRRRGGAGQDGSDALPLGVALARTQARDQRWLRAAFRLRRFVQFATIVGLLLALPAAWQLLQALRWNARIDAALAAPMAGGLDGTGKEGPSKEATASAAGEGSMPSAPDGAPTRAPAAGAGRDAPRGADPGRATRDGVPRADGAASVAALPASGASTASSVPAWLTDGSPPVWRFAQAERLVREGDVEGALARWRSVHDDPALGLAARYNTANALLREARRLSQTAAPGQALVLFELAKEGYRSVLRRDPGFWAARYNLERALALQPDGEEVEGAPPGRGERAATTMRSVSRGLP